MKKEITIFVALCALLLSGCGAVGADSDTLSDADMATRVAAILTTMPTTTALPTFAPADTEAPQKTPTLIEVTATAVVEEEETAEEEEVTETPEVEDTPGEGTPTVTNTPVAAFTAPATDPRNSLGDADWTDVMDDDTSWPLGYSEFTEMSFGDGMLVLKGTTDTSGWRLATANKLENYYLEMTVAADACSGTDNWGIISRVPNINEADQGYLFGISCDGRYFLKKWDGKVEPSGKMTVLVNFKANSAIQSGANKTNRMGIMAVGNRLIMYVNGVKLEEVVDSSFSEGYFGPFVNSDSTLPLVVRIDEMAYWKDPTP